MDHAYGGQGAILTRESSNSLLLLAGVGVTAWIVYAVNAKGATVGRPVPIEYRVKPGERWRISLRVTDARPWSSADQATLEKEMSGLAVVESVRETEPDTAGGRVLSVTLKYLTPATLPEKGTTMKWGTGTATLLAIEGPLSAAEPAPAPAPKKEWPWAPAAEQMMMARGGIYEMRPLWGTMDLNDATVGRLGLPVVLLSQETGSVETALGEMSGVLLIRFRWDGETAIAKWPLWAVDQKEIRPYSP